MGGPLFRRKPKILVVLHQESSTPGRVGMMLENMGYRLDIRRPVLDDPLPDTMEEHTNEVWSKSFTYQQAEQAADLGLYVLKEGLQVSANTNINIIRGWE